MDYILERDELDRELRNTLTPEELAMLSQQLRGAVTAIDVLRDRAPNVLHTFLAHLNLLRTDDVSDQAALAVCVLLAELRAARLRHLPKPLPAKSALRIVRTIPQSESA